jgi:hypothetical protein
MTRPGEDMIRLRQIVRASEAFRDHAGAAVRDCTARLASARSALQMADGSLDIALAGWRGTVGAIRPDPALTRAWSAGVSTAAECRTDAQLDVAQAESAAAGAAEALQHATARQNAAGRLYRQAAAYRARRREELALAAAADRYAAMGTRPG